MMVKICGSMVGFDEAIKWVEKIYVPDGDVSMKDRVLARMRYERDNGVKHARWVAEDEGLYVCPECGFSVMLDEDFIPGETDYFYCPDCGTKMDGGGNDV